MDANFLLVFLNDLLQLLVAVLGFGLEVTRSRLAELAANLLEYELHDLDEFRQSLIVFEMLLDVLQLVLVFDLLFQGGEHLSKT